jgi:hypothetical protein
MAGEFEIGEHVTGSQLISDAYIRGAVCNAAVDHVAGYLPAKLRGGVGYRDAAMGIERTYAYGGCNSCDTAAYYKNVL